MRSVYPDLLESCRMIVSNRLQDCISTTNTIYHFLYGLVYADSISDNYTALIVGKLVNDTLERIQKRTVTTNTGTNMKKTIMILCPG